MTGEKLTTRGRYGIYVPYAMLLSDFVVLNILLFIALCLNPHITPESQRMLLVLINAAYIPLARMSMPQRRERALHMDRLAGKAFTTVLLHAVIFLALVAFLEIPTINWTFCAEFYGMLIIGLPLSWIVTRLAVKAIRRRGRNYVDVIIIGHDEHAQRIATELQRDPGYGFKIHGFFDNTPPERYGNGRYLGDIDNDLPAYLDRHHIDEIYYTLSGSDTRLNTVLRMADDQMVTFYFVPRLSRSVARTFHLRRIGSIPVLAAHNNPLDNHLNRAVKRAFDITFSGLFLLISPLIFIPIAIGIKATSPGPVFFKQLRTGYKGHEFLCWKFRTMRVNNDSDRRQATADDPRKTRFGNFLRRTSLDELPQFINVLRGDMSVVGPRPHMVKQTEDYSRLIDRYMLRHVVKPGITGWAQVVGYRGATEELWQMEGRVEKDVWYIENWNLLLDIKIIIRTIT
ncbi:MAG: undecaprenyl-phosphate glucose phosphotransferase, partial [Muribaculaceae bacterium]|nr:undecaprenyl-phosphate glucose phosphotransferase [Muribaculaceae bacterium]